MGVANAETQRMHQMVSQHIWGRGTQLAYMEHIWSAY